MYAGKKPSLEAFTEAAENAKGIMSVIAQQFDVTRKTVSNWCKSDPEFQEVVEDQKDVLVDIGEAKLLENVNAGKEASVFFLLKTQGKKRGYIETVEVQDGGTFDGETKESLDKKFSKIPKDNPYPDMDFDMEEEEETGQNQESDIENPED